MKSDSMCRLMKDLAVDRVKNPRPFADEFNLEEEGSDDDDDDGNIIDRCTCSLRTSD